jgi:DNA repair exonuclease SbcCD ATPase subunit
LASVGYSGEGGTTVALERFCADLRDYRSVLFSDRQTEGERSARRAEYDGLIARLNNYFLRFGLSDSPRNNYEQLKDEMTQYRRLLEERSSEEQTKRTREEQAQRCLSQADGICAKYRIQCGDLGDLVRKLEQAAYTRQMLCERLKEAQERAKAYYAAQNLQSPPASGNLAEVQAQINARKDEMRRLDAQIAEEERQTETIPTLKTALQEAKEKEEQARLRYGLLSDTFDAISAAKTRLKEEYITPVRKGFLSYAERLEQILGDRMEMDSELAVSFERNGVRRSEKHLSTGEHALCMLCLRLALADRLFRESPFLILDDPFVALDGEHLDRAKQLLRELAGTRQIVYFCCHESRTL